MFEPVRGGTRGGQAQFKWSDVSADKDREHYLGHSINAPTGRWQKNKDVHWYNREKSMNQAERDEEIRKIKEAEADAIAVALGFAPSSTNGQVPVAAPSMSTPENQDSDEAKRKEEEKQRRKARRKEEKRARKAAKRIARDEHRYDRSESTLRRTLSNDKDRCTRRSHSRSPNRNDKHSSRLRDYDFTEREREREQDRRRWDLNAKRNVPSSHHRDR
ncbi:hypothetical protein ID866_3394 [Astraeus odoratus]|nr:hypothetical protein ID866_3394 [Astraeus odoratus]